MAPITTWIARDGDEGTRMAIISCSAYVWYGSQIIDVMDEAVRIFKRFYPHWTDKDMYWLASNIAGVNAGEEIDMTLTKEDDLLAVVKTIYDEETEETELTITIYEEGYSINGDKPA